MNTRTTKASLFSRTAIGLLLLLGGYAANAQVKVGNNPTTINNSSALEVESTNKGLLIPRMTTAQRNAISSPANGLLIYNTDNGCLTKYDGTSLEWIGIDCEADPATGIFASDCNAVSVQGTYTTGTALVSSSNTVTMIVNVTATGTYSVSASVNGMTFAAADSFSTLGTQNLVLRGSGYPTTQGSNVLTIAAGGNVCSTIINVGSGVAAVSSCGTAGTAYGPIGTFTANTVLNFGDVLLPLTNIAYTGGGIYSISTATTNGIQITSPLSGTFNGSPASIDLKFSGTPTIPGTTTFAYSINNQTGCSFSVPVLSGTGRASATTCAGTLSGSYGAGVAMTAGNTKVINLSVGTAGTFYVRTNTVNGVYFQGSASLATGAQTMTLTAVGTPVSPGSFDYTYSISSGASSFVTCTFAVVVTIPGTYPDFATTNCSTLGNTYTYIKAPAPIAGGNFGGDANGWRKDVPMEGTKLSADGLTLVVGSHQESSNGVGINPPYNTSAPGSGGAFVYVRPSLTGTWTFQAFLKPHNTGFEDFFGMNVDISADGNTIIVGASYEDGSGSGVNPTDDNSANNAGAAYVFSRTGSTWTQQAYIKASNCDYNDFFGSAVSISGDGNTIAVGNMGEDGSGAGINPTSNEAIANTGAVYVYTRSGSTWSFQAYMKSHNVFLNALFGRLVSLSNDGNTLAVTSCNEGGSGTGINPSPNGAMPGSGTAYVFSRTGTTWTQQAYIKASNPTEIARFGSSIDISGDGNRVVVGSIYEDGTGAGVNPPQNTTGSDQGAAYVFHRAGTVWQQVAYLKASNSGAGDAFGTASAISQDGNTIVVGAIGESGSIGCVNGADNNSTGASGAAYVYYYDAGVWNYSTKLKLGAVDVNDYVGSNISTNSNGKSIALGVGPEDGSLSGVNPPQNNSMNNAGAVFIYNAP